jgi:hypothetical protein
VWKSRASVLMATLTTVVSRIDMIAPSTTTDATSMTSRSSFAPAPADGTEVLAGADTARHGSAG